MTATKNARAYKIEWELSADTIEELIFTLEVLARTLSTPEGREKVALLAVKGAAAGIEIGDDGLPVRGRRSR